MEIHKVCDGLFCFLCVFVITYVEAQQNDPHGRQIRSAVTLTSVSVNRDVENGNDTRVTINYLAVKPVKVVWTVDEGFSPTALDGNASVTTTDTSTSVILPATLQFSTLHVQLLCTQELFELHLDLDKSQLSSGTFPVEPYDFYVPPKDEIGLSSRGESQFHVFVNLTATTFSFGMIAAEVTGKMHGRKGGRLYTHSAYSFLPDVEYKNLRLREIFSTKADNHYDVILKVPALYKYGGLLSLLVACPLSNSVIKRMDMKQTIHLHPKSKPVLPFNFVALADIGVEPNITVDKFGKAFLRCKAIGNPTPSLTLVKHADNINKKTTEVKVPTYDMTLPFEATKTFQFVNITASDIGQYSCKAENGRHVEYRKYIMSGL